MTPIETLFENVTNVIDGKEVGEALGILLSIVASVAITANLDREDVEDFTIEAIRKAYGAMSPSKGDRTH